MASVDFDNDFMDLDGFNDSYESKNLVQTVDLELLPDGTYTFALLNLATEILEKAGGKRVVRFILGVKETGEKYQYTYWMNSQESVNVLGGYLQILGVDTSGWGKQDKPLSKVLPAAMEAVSGKVAFIGKKIMRAGKDGNKMFCNLWINTKSDWAFDPDQFQDGGSKASATGDIPF